MRTGPKIAVVGGGVIGLSISWRLAQAGAEVTVFEAGILGNGASWAAAGMLSPGGEFEHRSYWSQLALDSLSLYPEFVDELMEQSGVRIDLRKCGAFEIGFDENEGEALRKRAWGRVNAGIYSEQFPASRIPGIASSVAAAQYYPDEWVVNPRDLVHALVIACERSRVQIREGEPIFRIDEHSPWDFSVIAAGAWSDQVLLSFNGNQQHKPQTHPVRGHLAAWDDKRGLGDAIIRHQHTYLLRRDPCFVIAGSSTENAGFDRTLDGGIVADIAERAAQIVPALHGRGYFAWNGLRPGTATEHPVIGRVRDLPVWLAYGHYRNCILLAPVTARDIASEIIRGDTTLASSQMDSFSRV